LQKRQKFWRICLLCTLLAYSNIINSFSAYSNDELDQLEKEFIQQINQSDSVLRNPLAVEYINHLAKKLAQHGELQTPDFFIVKSNEINAFAGPGGHIGVNTQLILSSANESELAAVMAHEMSHVRQHHLYRMMEHQKQMRVPMLASMLASIALGVINPTLASGALMGTLTGFAQDNINFVRSNEKEADSIGIDMLIKSGLDPRGMAGFFKKMQEATRYYYTEHIPAILRTHPLDEDRIAEAENRSLHITRTNYPDNINYRLFKELIRVEMARSGKSLLEYYERQCRKTTPANACQYGYVLTKIEMGKNAEAIKILEPLVQENPSNLYYAIAMARAEEGSQKNQAAVTRLKELHRNYPDNYAVLIEYGDALLENKQAKEAAHVLLRGRRQFTQDIPLCNKLARAQAANHSKEYAYFTLGECHILQGERQDALAKFKVAKTMAKNNKILTARIDARIDEIKAK
jgi:beta-barrel assembly-enhancing protease